MPTPRPIRSASSLENEAIVITCESSPITATPVPSDKAAVINGSSMARNEPNTMNNTTAAAMKPNSNPVEELSWFPLSAMFPSTWNWTPSPDADVIVDTKCLAAALVILFLFAASSNVTFANADLARRRDLMLGAGRERRADRRRRVGTCSTFLNKASARARTAGSVTLP